ncbi:pyridoxal phosphate-dependent aminotransferase [Nonomuraea deserti]|uniref:pyridoxal phosphate-dependent aminotransferase n=1 Tax=Nonomuraea deserti TaxID=1848322 RepID=UPI001404351B|nr:aminotransferase class I/II-fold pyridoxal phosphate-dependent enzyme [Nonomuraea deserti]
MTGRTTSAVAFGASAAARRATDPERDAVLSVPVRPGLVALQKGDPCFATPEHISTAQREAVAQGYTHYPELRGDPELRRTIADQISVGAARTYSTDEVLVTAGATQAVFCALTAFLDPADEVLLFDPAFSLYAPVVRQAGARPVSVGTTPDFRIDPDRLRAAVTGRTKMIVVNNPANPTGVVLSAAEVQSLAEIAVESRLLVLTDEVYDHILFGHRHIRLIDVPELADQVLYVNSFSKTYAMTGWRLGYVAAPRQLLDPIATIHINVMSQVHWPTQRAGIVALTGSQDCVRTMWEGYDLRRTTLLDALARVPGSRVIDPAGAFYAFLRFDPALGLTSAQVTAQLLDDGVAVRSGTEYGRAGEGWLRLTFAADLPDIERGAEIVRTTLERLAREAPTIAGRQR